MNPLAIRLHDLRTTEGLSYSEVERRSSVTRRTVRRIERGGMLTIRVARALDECFDGRLLDGLSLEGLVLGVRPVRRQSPHPTKDDPYNGVCTARLSDGSTCGEPCHKRTDGEPDRCVYCACQADMQPRSVLNSVRSRWARKMAVRGKAQR